MILNYSHIKIGKGKKNQNKKSLNHQYIYKSRDLMRESMTFYHVTHSMKRIEILLNHIKDNKKYENGDSLFPLVQYFKTTFNLLHFLFKVLRLLFISLGSMFQYLSSLTHTKKLFAFPFTIFTSAPLYTLAHNLSCHPISNTLKKIKIKIKNDVIYL